MNTTTDNTERSEVTDNAPVPTAQDFMNELWKYVYDKAFKNGLRDSDESFTAEDSANDATDRFSGLMPDKYPHKKTAEYVFGGLLSRARQQAFSEGRKQGLKEMYDSVAYNFNVNQFAGEETLRLRQEYSAK